MDQPQKYDKPWKSYASQLSDLENSGLIGATLHEEQIRRIGYYRLSGYWYLFREPGPENSRLDTFHPGAHFDEVLALYEFDSALRSAVFAAISRLEIAFRVEVGHVLGKRSTFGHLEAEHLDPSKVGKEFPKFLSKYHQLQSRSREDFVAHFQQKYLGVLPIWVATEILQMGDLVDLYRLCHYDDRKKIAEAFGPLQADEFSSWIGSLNYVRNICAHHGRFWNRAMVVSPKIPDPSRYPELTNLGHSANRAYGVLSALACLLKACRYDSERTKIKEVLETFPQSKFVSLRMLGAPADWATSTLWD